ncbi:hypothetical protein K437DRAFT_254931 [Tilletiaria anomala UBC 951]|uniref:Nuclear fusion protein KAR5 n=1 Tax=Tilletiaria anomala (strain ATCC 24038 / CBS 436.72 / UBC 951) TaxID=1037660 RepID=A0A066WCA3_TILAU|nr:uncharacterized protein K437DRAFT_254931 [Tilletiaria anomala UBC 951]KDN51341.1 hypothetical protein K437DRAFT_254931 [Tilletiaria anomala UBC 951]
MPGHWSVFLVLLLFQNRHASAGHPQAEVLGDLPSQRSTDNLRDGALVPLDETTSQRDMIDCQQHAAKFLRSRCTSSSVGTDERSSADSPSQLERMRISIEITRCEIEGAGLKAPAECCSSLLDEVSNVSGMHGSEVEGPLKHCVEALSRSPQLWTSYISHARDFDRQCHVLQRSKDVDQAKRLWRSASEQQRDFISRANDLMRAWDEQHMRADKRSAELLDALVTRLAQGMHAFEASSEQATEAIEAAARAHQEAVQAAGTALATELIPRVQSSMEAQLSNAVNAHAFQLQQAALKAQDRTLAAFDNLLQEFRQQSYSVSTELRQASDSTFALHRDVLTAQQSVSDIDRHLQILRATTFAVSDGLASMHTQVGELTRSVNESFHSANETLVAFESSLARSANNSAAFLDRFFNRRLIFFEAVLRMFFLCAPDILKVALLPLSAFALRTGASYAITSLLGLGQLIFAIALCLSTRVWRGLRRPRLRIMPRLPPERDLRCAARTSSTSSWPTSTREIAKSDPSAFGEGDDEDEGEVEALI